MDSGRGQVSFLQQSGGDGGRRRHEAEREGEVVQEELEWMSGVR